ncbi:MAG: hypothetical protein ACC645_02745 [Pirellulales bacterium]
MIGRMYPTRLGLLVIVIASPAWVAAAEPRGRRARAARAETPAETVEMFAAMEEGEIDVRFIALSDKRANLLIANKSDRPLKIKLPEAFVGMPVLAQIGGGGFGGGGGGGGIGGGGGSSGGQSLGGGGGGIGGGGGGIGGGGGGGFFNVAPEQVAKIKVPCLCLEHGKPDPTPKMKYVIRPIEDFVDRPAVVQLIKAFGTGQLSHRAAQAVVWHLNNDLSWQELAAKRGAGRLAFGGKPPYFTPQEMRLAVRIATESVRRARLEETSPYQPEAKRGGSPFSRRYTQGR